MSKWVIPLKDFRPNRKGASFAQDKFRVCLLIGGGEKSSASIIRATCAFDAKKVLDYRFGILVNRCQQSS